MEKRKAFQFYRSYYDVVIELENDKERLNFLMALLQKQFEDIEPNLTGMAKFAYVSQRHNIDSQVQGYKNKIGYEPPTQPPTYVAGDTIMTTEPPTEPPSIQEKEKEKEKEKEEVKEKVKRKNKTIIEKIELDIYSKEALDEADKILTLKGWK
jgi:outer membrane biosynthesis protein TonB